MSGAGTNRPLRRLDAALTGPRLPDAVALGLTVLLGWQLAGLTWAALPAPSSARLPAVGVDDASGHGSGAGEVPSAGLARMHLFGEQAADDDNDRPAATATDAPRTGLDLTLLGVYAPGGSGGLAIIAAGDGPGEVYAVTDTVADDARITGIHDDRVVLRRNGRAETLRMRLAEAPQQQQQQQRQARGDRGVNRQAPSRSKKPGGGNFEERARALRDRLRDDPIQTARELRVRPTIRDGQVIGFQAGPPPDTDEAELLRQAGIGADDVITHVNNISLAGRRQAGRALRQLRGANTFHFTLTRNGKQRVVSVPLGEPE